MLFVLWKNLVSRQNLCSCSFLLFSGDCILARLLSAVTLTLRRFLLSMKGLILFSINYVLTLFVDAYQSVSTDTSISKLGFM